MEKQREIWEKKDRYAETMRKKREREKIKIDMEKERKINRIRQHK